MASQTAFFSAMTRAASKHIGMPETFHGNKVDGSVVAALIEQVLPVAKVAELENSAGESFRRQRLPDNARSQLASLQLVPTPEVKVARSFSF